MDQSVRVDATSGPAPLRPDRLKRRAKLFQVSERLPKPELAFASLSFLGLRYLDDVVAGDVRGRLPYGADPGSSCLVYSLHEDPIALFRRPFLYQAQFESVQKVLAVPFDQLQEMDQDARFPASFVFSIGRCGSTLLAGLLGAAGLTAISEPDIFSQMARPEAQRFAPQERRECLAAAARCLAGYAPEAAVIKLRSACNTIAPLVMSSMPGARCEFLLRNRHDWARSMFAVGPFEATMLARQLAVAVMALDRLIELGYCSGPIWYEEIVRAPRDILKRFRSGPAVDGNAEVEKAMARDSQSGTVLSREQVAQRVVSDEMLNRFEDEWRKIRPQSILAKHGLKEKL